MEKIPVDGGGSTWIKNQFELEFERIQALGWELRTRLLGARRRVAFSPDSIHHLVGLQQIERQMNSSGSAATSASVLRAHRPPPPPCSETLTEDSRLFQEPDASRDFRLSMAESMQKDPNVSYLLYFHNLSECNIRNATTGVWESMPLLFSSANTLKLRQMELISSDAGLLYFSNPGGDELIAATPLTRQCSKMLVGSDATRGIDEAKSNTSKSFPCGESLRWHVTIRDPVLDVDAGREDVLTYTYTATDFEIKMKIRYPGSRSKVLFSQLKDSRRSIWINGPDVERANFFAVCFTTFLIHESRGKNIILGLSTHQFVQDAELLLYDMTNQEWYWETFPLSNPNLNTIYANLSGGELNFSEFVTKEREGDDLKYLGFLGKERTVLATTQFPPSTKVTLRKSMSFIDVWARTDVRQFLELFNFFSLSQRGDKYDVVLIGEDSAEGSVHIAVRTWDRETGLQWSSSWMPMPSSARDMENLVSSKKFHIFTPTLSSPR